jgi:heat-inducible transcriptional repressor
MSLTKRKGTILQIIVDEYIATAIPIASKTVAQNFGMKVSSATVRNDIADLAEEEYVKRSHLSAGAIPTDKAYRYYVESLNLCDNLSWQDQNQLREFLQKTSGEIEQWIQVVATFLAHLVHNAVIVTSPKALQCRFKHVDLVALQDFVALLIMVLNEAKVGKRILNFSNKITQDELTTISNKLNSTYEGMTSREIAEKKIELTPNEQQVTSYIINIIADEDRHECNKPYLEGLHLMLSQPEFTASEQIVNLLELLEEKKWWESILSSEIITDGIKVIIGKENTDEALQDLSLIISKYGITGKAKGIIGVIGPKRIDYRKVITSIDFFSSQLSRSMAEYIENRE